MNFLASQVTEIFDRNGEPQKGKILTLFIIEDSAIAEAYYVLASKMVIFQDVPDSITPQLLKPR